MKAEVQRNCKKQQD